MNKRIIFIGFLCCTGILISGCIHKSSPISKEGEFPEITETKCIMGVHKDYDSGILVRNETDIETVFNVFIRYSQEKNKAIFGDAYGNTWRFENATIHGMYQGIKYWKTTASWFSEKNQKWHIKTVFDVSERGEVVRLLGCI